jgi:hypothetical protein
MTQMRKKFNDQNINLIYYFSCIITQRTTISSWFHKFKLQKSDRFVLQQKIKKTLKQKAKSQKIERIKRKNKKKLASANWRLEIPKYNGKRGIKSKQSCNLSLSWSCFFNYISVSLRLIVKPLSPTNFVF